MYINMGDKNFFEHGILVDNEHSDDEIEILYCRPYDDEEDLFLFAHCTVNITDSWIDKESVAEFSGLNEINYNDIHFAIGCIEYYGVEEFSSSYEGYQFTRKEIEEKLKHYLIANDNLDITW